MRSGFFNNTAVTAEDFAHFAGGILTNGVLMNDGGEMEVSAGSSGMTFNVAAGYCWINGRFGQAENTETVALTNGDGTNPRKDRIVARLDIDANTVSIQVITGTPAVSPTAPDIVRTSSVYDLGLAVVDVPRGATSASACTVTDTRRDTGVCGGVFPNLSGAVVWPSANIVGEVRIFAGDTAPDRWLFCRGQEVAKDDYPDLFAVIGYTYGGSGSIFQLPDLRERFPKGVNPDGSDSAALLGGAAGHKNITLTVAQLPSHSHTLSGLTGSLSASKLTAASSGTTGGGIDKVGTISATGGWTVGDGSLSGLSGSVGNTGSGNSIDITPKYLNVNYIIYTGVSAG